MEYEYHFTGRKPSKAQIKSAVIKALKAGHSDIEIIWGENGLSIERWDTGLIGHGWIKNIGGHDLAKEISL